MSGVVSSLGGSMMQNRSMSAGSQVAMSAVLGGTAEALGGGKFANGAITGAFVMLFNHLQHAVDNKNKEKGNSVSETTIEIAENDPYTLTIEMQRIAESSDATLSEFTAFGPVPYAVVTGYILEPGGPSTTASGQDQRIPAGTYSVDPYSSKTYKDNYIISNGLVSPDRHILIHVGNYHSNTAGCLLPGSSYSKVGGNYAVWSSGEKFKSLRSLLGTKGATLYIYDIQ
ncbi:MAG: DUF5675 family protein [Lentimicrobiaceae bacterium]|jgi:hypothetical protein|nr:DUF5675 family protein [Lentimicrobiaceae bacterium]